MKKVVVLAAHPDDEILGCGGTIAKLAKDGCHVTVIIAAEGITSRAKGKNNDVKRLHKICKEANLALGVKDVVFLGFPDNRMDSVDFLDIVQTIEGHLAKIQPTVIFTHHLSDLNIDHRICNQAVITACRPLPNSKIKEIYFFEVPSSTDWNFSGNVTHGFRPNYFVDITDDLKQKIAALKKYTSEMREFPHARSLEGCEYLAKWRGSTVGLHAAEAFETGRIIVE